MSRYVDIIQDAIEGLQKYVIVEEELISLCRKAISQNERTFKTYNEALSKDDSDAIESAHQDWTATKAKANLAFDILSILGYKVDHYFMDSPIIVAWED